MDAGEVREALTDELGVTRMRVDAGAYRGRAEIDLVYQQRRFLQALLVFSEHYRVGRELLPERHRHRVLELRATHLEHGGKFRRIGFESPAQLRHRFCQTANAEVQ